jgi:DNA-binding LacI/PurR family transcriptional regulator
MLEIFDRVAQAAGVSPSTVYRWAVDRYSPMQRRTRHQIETVARRMGIPIPAMVMAPKKCLTAQEPRGSLVSH